MKCPLCGHRFREEEGKAACMGCPLARSCNMVACPNCGYEVPLEPRLIKVLRKWRSRYHGAKRKG